MGADQRPLEHDRQHGGADRAADALEHVELRCGVGELGALSEANAAAIAGMKANPIPIPRMNMAIDRSRIDECALISPNGTVASVVTITPISANGPPP